LFTNKLAITTDHVIVLLLLTFRRARFNCWRMYVASTYNIVTLQGKNKDITDFNFLNFFRPAPVPSRVQ